MFGTSFGTLFAEKWVSKGHPKFYKYWDLQVPILGQLWDMFKRVPIATDSWKNDGRGMNRKPHEEAKTDDGEWKGEGVK